MNPVGIPVEGMAQMFATIQQMAKEEGRDPSLLEMIVRANLHITHDPLPEGRFIFSGTFEQVVKDVAACRSLAPVKSFDSTLPPTGKNSRPGMRFSRNLAQSPINVTRSNDRMTGAT